MVGMLDAGWWPCHGDLQASNGIWMLPWESASAWQQSDVEAGFAMPSEASFPTRSNTAKARDIPFCLCSEQNSRSFIPARCAAAAILHLTEHLQEKP
mmetsp:Transcript_39320/g.111346  ORF Transcript_39320/g.111346 Transcript_39320/m.111346 type:complete len:97 (+) Transcript_39320:445-735(+)